MQNFKAGRSISHKPMNQAQLTIKLILDDIVESLEKKKHEMVVLGYREQEPGGGEGLQQVEQFVGSHHRKTLQVRRHCTKCGNH